MSNSRLEKFIYAICSMEVSDLPAPLSRIEILWNCLITGETPDFEPQSRNEQYLMAMLGLYELENLPTPLSRGEKLLYKIAMGETDLSDIPAYLSRYEELLGYLAENGGVGDFEYILQTLNQRLSTLYSTKERPMKQAVIKGDTLVNELPRPSLKNTMTNAESQKLNHGYDNGKTLVNLCDLKDNGIFQSAYNGNKANRILGFMSMKNTIIQPNTKYLVKFRITNYINESGSTIPLTSSDYHISSNTIHVNGNGYYTISAISASDMSNYGGMLIVKSNATFFENNTTTNISFTISEKMVIEYQDGMENWDIPYFEGTKTFSATPNVVDGEFKQAVVKGQTLVNIKGDETKEATGETTYPNHDFLIPLVKKNTDYLIKYDTTITGGVLAVGFLKDTGSWSKNLENRPNAGIVKLNSGEYPNYFRIIGQTGVTITVNNLIIIEYQEGMENWDIPYFEGMQSVQLSEVTTTGKNLFDGKNMSNGYISTSGGIDAGNIHNSLSDYIKVEPSTSYAYKCFVENQTSIYGEFAFFDEDKKFISVLYSHHTSNTCIITPDNCHYLRAWNNQYEINGNSHPNAMLVKTTNLPSTLIYEPYQSNTLTLAEPVTLRKVGDVEDEFDALTGQVTERVGEVVLDGSQDETWETDISNPNNYKFLIELPNINCNATSGMFPEIVISDKFPSVNNGDPSIGKDVESVCINGWANRKLNLSISKTKLTDMSVNSLREYLSQNPFTVQYQLKTPITKTVIPTITNQDNQPQTKLHSFNDGHLSVSSQGLLPSAVNYEVPTNNSYYLPDMLTLGAQYTSRGSADCNATIDGKLLALGKNRTFTTPSTLTNRLMVLDAPVDDLMFIKGDHTAKDFGYFEGMKSVEVSSIQVTGKNLFDGVSYIDAFIGPNMNVNNDRDVVSILLDVEKNTDYILSTKTSFDRSIIGGSTTPIMIRDILNRITSSRIGNTIAFNSGDYTHIMIYLSSTKINIEEIQVEKGTVATPYEPYKSTTLTLNEPVTLRKVGDAQDTLDGLTGEVTERIGEIMPNESLNYQGSSSANGENTMYFQLDLGAYPNSIPVSSHFKVSSANLYVSTNDYEGIRITGSGSLQLRVLKSKLNSLDVKGLKEYLKQNNISLQYRLTTETVKTVDLTTVDQDGQSTKLKTFNDISHVEINADNMIPSVDVEIATKISETLSTLGLDHHDISETQNELGQTIDEQAENTDATMMATTEIYEQTL